MVRTQDLIYSRSIAVIRLYEFTPKVTVNLIDNFVTTLFHMLSYRLILKTVLVARKITLEFASLLDEIEVSL